MDVRTVLRIGLGILAVVAVIAAVVLFAAAALSDVPDERDAALIVGGACTVLACLLLLGVRGLRRGDGAPRLPADLERAEHGETIELRPSRRRWILMLLGSLVFSVVLVPLAFLAPNVVTVSGGLLFGLGVVVSAWQLVPGAAYLRVSPQGMEMRAPFRHRTYAWNEIDDFRVYTIHTRYATHRFVGFDLRDRTPERQTLWQTINRGMSEVDVSLPDTYGLDAKDLARDLDRVRRRHQTVRGLSPSARADRELRRAAERVDTSRRPAVTWTLAVLCAVVFVGEVVVAGVFPTAGELVDLGGASEDAPWWTLLTANLLHAGPFHLACNLLAWGFGGYLLEREIGWRRMAGLAAVSAFVAMGAAVLLHPAGVTVGLSGVVFAALAWGIVRDVHRTRALGAVAWSILPVGVIYTFFSPGTSIGAHLGGLAVGLAFGALDRRANPTAV